MTNKKLIFLGIGLFLFFCLIGCSLNKGNEAENNINVPVQEIATRIQSELEWPALLELDDEMLQEIYKLDPKNLDSYIAKIPLMNVKTDELTVIKTTSLADVKKVKEAILQRAENIKKSFENYLPDQYEKAVNNLIKSNGRYILFVIHEERNKAEEIFDNFFK